MAKKQEGAPLPKRPPQPEGEAIRAMLDRIEASQQGRQQK